MFKLNPDCPPKTLRVPATLQVNLPMDEHLERVTMAEPGSPERLDALAGLSIEFFVYITADFVLYDYAVLSDALFTCRLKGAYEVDLKIPLVLTIQANEDKELKDLLPFLHVQVRGAGPTPAWFGATLLPSPSI